MDTIIIEKLNGFIDAVNEEVNEDIRAIAAEAEQEQSRITETAENEALNESYLKISREVKRINASYQRLYAKEEQDIKRNLLTHREVLVRKIFSDIEEKLSKFTLSSEYPEYLYKLLSSEETSEETVVFLKPDDMKYVGFLTQRIGRKITFKADSSIKMGGLSKYDGKKAVVLDKTLDSALEDERRAFSANYKF